MSGGADRSAYDVNEIAKMEMLRAAYEMDNDEVLRRIAEDRVHVDSFDDDRVTALQIAAATGNSDLVRSLLEAQADVDLCNQVGLTPFHLACREGHLKVIEILLQHGADAKRLTFLGVSALTLAAGVGHAEVVKKLIGCGIQASGGGKENLYSPTPLIAACFRGNPATLIALVRKGRAPVSEVSEALYNLSPLSCAVMLSPLAMVSCLLDLGANIHQQALRHRSAHVLAVQQRRGDVLNLFNEYHNKRNFKAEVVDVRQLIVKNELEKLRQVLVGYQRQHDVFPMIFATSVTNYDAIRVLSECLPSSLAEHEPRLRLNSLMLAALQRDVEMCELLLQKDIVQASIAAMTNLYQTAYDLFHVSLEEPVDLELRGLLAVLPNRPRAKLSQSSNTFSKFFKRRPNERSTMETPLRMREWIECRAGITAMHGRNHSKLTLVEDVLRGRREFEKRRDRQFNRNLDGARAIVQESMSFAVKCFYDVYSDRESSRPNQEKESGETDIASHLSIQYGFRGKRRDGSSSNSSSGRLAPLQPRVHLLSETAPTASPHSVPSVSFSSLPGSGRLRRGDGGASRTTPRMLKKSRECLPVTSDERRSIHDEAAGIRRMSAAIQLTRYPCLASERSVPFSESQAAEELRRRGMDHLIALFESQEIEQEELVNEYTDEDFLKMDISVEDIQKLRLVQDSLRAQSPPPLSPPLPPSPPPPLFPLKSHSRFF